MKRRILALLLTAAALTGCLAACGKGEKPDAVAPPNAVQGKRMEAETVTSKYAYSAEYIDLPVDVDYITTNCVSGNYFYFTASVKSGTDSFVDPDSGEGYSYDTYDLKLIQMDLSTRECTELDALDAVQAEGEEGWRRDMYVQNMTAAPDGGVCVYVQTNSYRLTTPAEGDAANFGSYNYEGGTQQNLILFVGADGKAGKTVDLSAAQGGDFYPSDFLSDAKGYLYLGDFDRVRIWDKDGNFVTELELGPEYSNLMQYGADKIGVVTYGQTHVFKVIDPVKKAFGETLPLPADAYQIYPGDNIYDFFYDNSGKIYGYISQTKTAEKVIDWLECDVDSNNMTSFSILPDGHVFAMTQEYRRGRRGSSVQLILMTRVDASTLPQKKNLTLACMYLDSTLRSQIVRFNLRNPQYRIVVRDYSEYNTENDISLGMTKLTTELAAGTMPDMLLTTSLPVRQYEAKGLLRDLTPMLDADSTLSRDDLITEVLDARAVDGKLYRMPTSFMISAVAGRADIVGGYETWTLDDVQDAMKKLQPGATVFSEFYTKESVLSNCVSDYMDALVDWENGVCRFDGEEFRSLLAFANQFPLECDYSRVAYNESDFSRMKAGKQLLMFLTFHGFDALYGQFALMDNAPCFVGFPVPASCERVRSRFILQGELAITAACSEPDAAWAFIRSVLSEDYQSQIWSFPILRSAFDDMLAEAMKQEFYTDANGRRVERPKGGVSYGSDEMIDRYAVTEQQKDILMELIRSTDRVSEYDDHIMSIVIEETGAYFAGQKTLDETVKVIQNRMNLYVAEQR